VELWRIMQFCGRVTRSKKVVGGKNLSALIITRKQTYTFQPEIKVESINESKSYTEYYMF
jgi:hypothetical protein